MCNGVAHACILAVTLQVVATVPQHAAEAEVPWAALGARTRTIRCVKSKRCIGACVRKVPERNGARAYRHGAAAAGRIQRQPEHAGPPPQHARKTTFHLSVLRSCSGVATSRRTPVFRRHLRGRGNVTLFIAKKSFSEGCG